MSMNLRPFPDPYNPNGPIPGDAIPVALLGDIFTQQLIIAAQAAAVGADLLLKNGIKMNPLDLFGNYPRSPSGTVGVALVIVNSLSTPLTLVDSYEYDDDNDKNDKNGPQLSYPATIDPRDKSVSKPHVIPGVRPYPIASKHVLSNGDPGQLSGVGLYRFQSTVTDDDTAHLLVTRGLAFAVTPNGSKQDPLIGVAIKFDDPLVSWAVTADVSSLRKGDTPSNLKAWIENGTTGVAGYDQQGDYRIFGCWAAKAPAYEPHMNTVVVWVSPASPIVPPNVGGNPGGGN